MKIKLFHNFANNICKKWWFKTAAIFLLGGIFIYFSNDLYAKAFPGKIFPKVSVNGVALGRLDQEAARKELQQAIDQFNLTGLIYKYQDKEINISMISQGATDPDLSSSIITFDLTKTITESYHYGRSQSYLTDLWSHFKSLFFGQEISLGYNLNEVELKNILNQNFSEYLNPAVNAGYQIENDQISLIAEEVGTDFDYQKIISLTNQQIKKFDNKIINLNIIVDLPEVYQKEITAELIEQVADLLKIPEIKLIYNDKNWFIKKEEFQKWFAVAKLNKQVKNEFSADYLESYLSSLAQEINVSVKDAKFALTNGKVSEFEPGSDGLELMLADSIKKINNEFFDNQQTSIELVVEVTPAKSQVGSLNDLGIKENIGTGHSNFKGSPPNRIYNIGIGAETLNGILIAPNETFSLVKALSPIDASAGYRQELVIKGNKTIPEYGGGLCQIGTTTFRAALASGLPIIERQSHAYRVVYYEPAGTDATIYDPKPDMRFLNDTGHYILIQTKIVGNNLYFEFWGTKDSRLIEQTTPVIYNITSPGPTKYIESEEVSEGEKCIETPHSGADTYFNYKITYPLGEIKEETFRSHYVPWPKVCLVPLGSLEGEATSTPSLINS